MKKIIALILATVMVMLAVAACGGNDDKKTTDPTVTTTNTTNTTNTTGTQSTIGTDATTSTGSIANTTTGVVTPPPAEDKFDASKLVWSPATAINDGTGVTYTFGKDNGDGTFSYNECRYAMTTFIEVNPGDTITLDSEQYVFILYGYSDTKGTYKSNNYIDVTPGDAPMNWGTSYTFTEGTHFGAEGAGEEMQYPLYVRLVIKDITNGSAPVPADIKDKFTFDIKAPNEHLANEENEFNPFYLTWLQGSTVDEATGALACYVTNNKNYPHRIACGNLVKLSDADVIALNKSAVDKDGKFVFTIYAYDLEGNYIGNIDVDTADETTTWGTEFEMVSGMKTVDGKDVPDVFYARIVVKHANGNVNMQESIRNEFYFDISTKQD